MQTGFHVLGPKLRDLAVQIRADMVFRHNLPLESADVVVLSFTNKARDMPFGQLIEFKRNT